MPKYATEAIRTVALVGHTGAGKTTLAEALLAKAGAIASAGSVERGNTACDFDPLEREYRHSLNSAIVNFAWKGTHVHLIDTPGSPDFMGQAISALAAVETAIVVINAETGIQLATDRMLRWAAKRNLCRMIVINRIDAENADLPATLERIRQAVGRECLPINLPAKNATGVVDCFFNPSGESDFSSVEAAHSALVDQVVEVDEKLMEKYLEQGEIEPEALHAPFEKALREGHLIPVCFTSARNGAGVEALLDIFAKLAPNATEGNAPPFLKGEGAEAQEFFAVPGAKAHVLAHVFKVVVDPFVGKVGIFRVHQGTMTPNSQLFIGSGKRPFKAGHLFAIQGKDYVETDALDEDHIHLRPLEFPVPMHGIAVETKKKGDEQRLFEVLHKLEMEDPCFKLERHAITNETVIRGLGELHIRCKLEKLSQQYKMELSTKPPKIPYRETITRVAEGHCRHKKQTGGAGQFGEVFLRIEPLPRGKGYEFLDKVKGGVIPNVFIPAVEKGVRMALDSGVIAGYPVHDLRVTVYDGKHHAVDSKEVAFVSAGRKAVIDAFAKAGAIVLEPIVNVEIVAPDRFMGDLTNDLSGKRGHVTGTDTAGGDLTTIKGLAPLSELSDYQTRLRSVTGGQGSYSIDFSHYAPVPPHTQAQLVGKHKQPVEEEQ
jgi:elongation factor G